jgi:hypothetical protein
MSADRTRVLAPCAVAALLGLSALLRTGPAPLRAEETGWLTSRPLPAAKEGKPLPVGEEVRTAAGQRRRVLLPDGPAVYLNEKTTLKLEGPRRLTLAAGEVFVDDTAAKPSDDLVVRTPKREVAARATRLAVRAEEKGTGVVVASGRARVSGLDKPLTGGQQLPAGAGGPVPAPRVSHLLAWAQDLLPGPGLVPPSAHAGGSLVARDPEGQEAKLALRKYHIDVHAEDGFARTTIDQTYFNHTAERLEGTFYFPLPPDASLSRLAMYVDGKLMEGGMAERDYARAVYEQVVYQQKDPALLEWVDGSTFKMRVFPLEGRQEKRIVLSYTQRLPSLYGQLSYRFPAGHSLGQVRDWSFHARVRNGEGLTWASPSHPLAAGRDGADLLLDAAAKDVKPDRDVVLTLAEKGPGGEAVRFSSAEADGGKYLMVRYRPGLAGAQERRRRDWVFLVETSGDRDPLLARTQIEVVRGLLSAAEEGDTFTVRTAGTRTRGPDNQLWPVTPESVSAAVRYLEAAHLIGALDLGRAMNEVAPVLKAANDPVLVHVGSGVAAMGEARVEELVKRVPAGTQYVGVGVGRRWERSLMKALAERTAGYFTQINPDEQVAWRTFDLAATLNTPRLLDVSVTDKAGRATFLPFTTMLAQGEELAAVARLDGGATALPEAVLVRGTLNGERFERELPVKDVAAQADYLPRTWAKLEIERLLAEDARKHKDRVVALSKAMYVMTPFTSLLVLENEDMYTRFKVDRGRKDHWALYPCPEKVPVVFEPEDGQVGDPRRGLKPSARRVVKTVLVRESPRVLGAPAERSAVSATSPEQTGVLVFGPGVMNNGIVDLTPRPLTPLRDFAAGNTGYAAETAGTTAGSSYAGRLALNDPAQAHVWGSLPEARPSGGAPDVQEQLADRFQWERIRVDNSLVPRLSPEERARGERQLQLGLPANNFAGPPDKVGFGDSEAAFGIGNGTTPAGARFNDWAVGLRLQMPVVSRAAAGEAVNEMRVAPNALLYRRPSFSGDERLFYDLLAYAPGLNTSSADVLAVLEAEAAPSLHAKPGRIDAAARALLDKARPAGWRALTLPADGERAALTVHFDGQGRYAYERVLPVGLRERVVCDGKTLWHLHPDLGLAARRAVSRFHRLAFARSVPWAVPPAEDLARGADLRALDARTVAVVPHGAGAKDREGKPLPHLELRLVFADGRLAERQLVRMPSGKVLAREVVGADGTLRELDGDGKEIAVHKGELREGTSPDLKPDVGKLVVLDLPYRTAEHVLKSRQIEKTPHQELRFADAVALLAAYIAAKDMANATNVFQQALHRRDQRQLGLYVLLAACGQNLDSEHLDVLAEHDREPVAQYLALHSSPVLRKHASQWAAGSNQWGEGLLRRLALTHALLQRWQNGKAVGGTEAQRRAERERALEFVRRYKGTAAAWALLGLMQDRAREDEARKKDVRDTHRALAEAWLLFEGVPGLGYAARYEHARSLWKAGQREQARERFRAVYESALKDKVLPRIDEDFRQALTEGKGGAEWGGLLRRTARTLIEQKQRPAVLALASQCWQLDDKVTADDLVAVALDGLGEKERRPMKLAALEFFWKTGQLARADGLLNELLRDPELARRAGLWHLGARLAERRTVPARELECLERALDAEFRDPPEVVNLRAVRAGYEKLLSRYQALAESLATLRQPPPAGFRAKVVRAADRWRALDRDSVEPCRLAARVLRTLGGDRELVWDYLTTPVTLRPREAEPWASLAQQMQQAGEAGLADRAFQAAFEAEPTNAQFLWDRAQHLGQTGQTARARALYRQLAEGTWQPRFAWVQAQARRELEKP